MVVVLVRLLAVVGSISYHGWRQTVAGVRASVQAPKAIGHNASFTVTLEAARGNVNRAEVRIVQGGKPVTLPVAAGLPARRVQVPVSVEPAAVGLKEGAATLEVWAGDDYWRPFRPAARALVSS